MVDGFRQLSQQHSQDASTVAELTAYQNRMDTVVMSKDSLLSGEIHTPNQVKNTAEREVDEARKVKSELSEMPITNSQLKQYGKEPTVFA